METGEHNGGSVTNWVRGLLVPAPPICRLDSATLTRGVLSGPRPLLPLGEAAMNSGICEDEDALELALPGSLCV